MATKVMASCTAGLSLDKAGYPELRDASRTLVRLPAALLLVASLISLTGCGSAPARRAANDLFAATAQSYASDDDPELVREASPFGLKLLDALILRNPEDPALLLSAARGYAQYAFGFVQQEGDETEDKNIELAQQQYERARNLYRRAMNYGWRGLEVEHPNVQAGLHTDLAGTLKRFDRDDVPLLYWTALSLGALINLSKDDAELVAEVPVMEGLMDRALALEESYEAGAIRQFLIGYEMNRRNRKGEPGKLAREHFYRAVQLSQGRLAACFVILAESVMVREQNRAEFEQLLATALKIDADAEPDWRLANLLWQKRARWLLSRKEQLFSE